MRASLIIAALLDQIENCFVVREESRSGRVIIDEYDMWKKESRCNVNGATRVEDFHGLKSLLEEFEEAAEHAALKASIEQRRVERLAGIETTVVGHPLFEVAGNS